MSNITISKHLYRFDKNNTILYYDKQTNELFISSKIQKGLSFEDIYDLEELIKSLKTYINKENE